MELNDYSLRQMDEDAIRKLPEPAVRDLAVRLLKEMPPTKFDATVELVMHLGIDPRQADQALRGAFAMPHGIGAKRKVIAFCDGESVAKAQAAGAIEAGGEELA